MRRRRRSPKTSSKLMLTAKTSRIWTAAVMNLDASQRTLMDVPKRLENLENLFLMLEPDPERISSCQKGNQDAKDSNLP